VYEEDWLNFTIPYKNSALDACNRYAVNETLITDPSSSYCDKDYFTEVSEACGQDFKFRDEEKTISTEVGIR